jgi:hypothetical protein
LEEDKTRLPKNNIDKLGVSTRVPLSGDLAPLAMTRLSSNYPQLFYVYAPIPMLLDEFLSLGCRQTNSLSTYPSHLLRLKDTREVLIAAWNRLLRLLFCSAKYLVAAHCAQCSKELCIPARPDFNARISSVPHTPA